MTNDAVGILTNKFKYNIRSARFEYKYLNEIEDFLNLMNIDYIEQYQVDNYRIDLYIPKYNIAIEIDEEEHKYKKNYDTIRQKYIEKQIHCKFIRVTPLYKFFIRKMPYETLWCIISLQPKLHERSDLIRQTYYTTTNT